MGAKGGYGSDNLEGQIRKLMDKKIRQKLACSKCGNVNLEYQGSGKYICKECGEPVFNNYGKVRNCLENYGSMPVIEVMEKTGLTRADIKQLEEEGSIVISVNGKIGVS